MRITHPRQQPGGDATPHQCMTPPPLHIGTISHQYVTALPLPLDRQDVLLSHWILYPRVPLTWDKTYTLPRHLTLTHKPRPWSHPYYYQYDDIVIFDFYNISNTKLFNTIQALACSATMAVQRWYLFMLLNELKDGWKVFLVVAVLAHERVDL